MKIAAKNFNTLMFFLLTLTLTYGQNPSRDLQDIVGEKGNYAEMDLEKRGYVHIKTNKIKYNVYSSWWNPGLRKCVTYHLADGRIQSVVDVPSYDCNKSDNQGYSQNWSSSHSSYHHENNTHYNNRDHEMAYERGHSDGLHNKAYHNIYGVGDLKNAYADGYNSGVRQRGYNTSYHSSRGGYQSHVRVDDLIGMTNDKTLEALVNRGFTLENTYAKDHRLHRIFYNSKTRQCIDVIGRDKHTRAIENSSRCD